MPNQIPVFAIDLKNAKLCLQFLNDTFKPEKIPADSDERFIEQYENFKAFLTMMVNAEIDEIIIDAQHNNFYSALHKMFHKVNLEKHLIEMGVDVTNMEIIVLDADDDKAMIQNLLIGGNDLEH